MLAPSIYRVSQENKHYNILIAAHDGFLVVF